MKKLPYVFELKEFDSSRPKFYEMKDILEMYQSENSDEIVNEVGPNEPVVPIEAVWIEEISFDDKKSDEKDSKNENVEKESKIDDRPFSCALHARINMLWVLPTFS